MKKQEKQKPSNLVIYQAKNGDIELKGDYKKETIWATQAQVAEAFSVNVRTINEHLNNIYRTNELDRKSTIRNFRIVQKEGGREVQREVQHYNLDAIISVGYRVNSKTATAFRKWATKILKEHITKGYTIDRKKVIKNYDAFLKSISDVQSLLPEQVILDPKNILDLIKEFASTWISLDAYDKEELKISGFTKKTVKLTGEELFEAINNLKKELLKKNEATDIFATEKQKGAVVGIVGNVMQSIGGKNVYKSVEEKASHLLYFMVKNHPFVDGNKRSGAFSFIWFLKKTGAKGVRNINPATLTTLTLLIAESNPNKKDQMVALITQLLKN